MAARLPVAAALLLALLLVTGVPGGHAVPSWPVRNILGIPGAATCSSTCPAKVKPGGDWVKDCLVRECAGEGKVKLTVNAGKAGCDWSNIILTPTSPDLASSCVLRVDKSSTVQVIATALPCGTYDIDIKQGTYNACPLGAYLDAPKFSSSGPTACTKVGEVPKTGTGLWSGNQWCEIASVNLCKDDSNNDLDAKCNDGNVCTTDTTAPNCGCTYTNNAVSCSNPTWPNGVVDACKNGGQCSGGVCIPQYKPDTQSCSVSPGSGEDAACIYGTCKPSDGTCEKKNNNTNTCTPTWGASVSNDCKNGGQCSEGICAPQYKPATQSCGVSPTGNEDAACIYGRCKADDGTCTKNNNDTNTCTFTAWGNGVSNDCQDGGQCAGGACGPKYKPTDTDCAVTPTGDQVAACIYGKCNNDGTCPTLYKDNSQTCGSAPTDSCDAQDTCGTSAEGKQGQCVDRLVAHNTPCKPTLTSQDFRPLANCCDAPDVCDGTSKSCRDVFQPNTVPCLTVKEVKDGSCQDKTYNCQGTSATCNYQPPAGFLTPASR